MYFPWGLSQDGPKDFFDFLCGFIGLLKWCLKDFTSFLNGSIDFPEGLLKGCTNLLREFIGLLGIHFRTSFTCFSRISITFPRISNASLRGGRFTKGFPEESHWFTSGFQWTYLRASWRISLLCLSIYRDFPKGSLKNVIDFFKDFIDLLKGTLQEFSYFLRVS